MPSTGQTDVIFAPTGGDNSANETVYRTVSSLAVVSLIVGIVAPLCFLAPLLYAIPLFGLALAVLALRRIALSDDVMIGRSAAVAGLALCVASICAAASHGVAVEYLRIGQAKDVGSAWIQLVLAGESQQAFDLTTTSLEPPNPHREGPATEEDRIARFVSTPAVQALLEFGQQASVRFERNLSYELGSSGECVIQQQYVVTPAAGAERAPMTVRVKLQRGRLPNETRLRWLVVSCTSDDADAATAAG